MNSAPKVVQLGQEGVRLISVGSKGPHLVICSTSILYGQMKGGEKTISCLLSGTLIELRNIFLFKLDWVVPLIAEPPAMKLHK